MRHREYAHMDGIETDLKAERENLARWTFICMFTLVRSPARPRASTVSCPRDHRVVVPTITKNKDREVAQTVQHKMIRIIRIS